MTTISLILSSGRKPGVPGLARRKRFPLTPAIVLSSALAAGMIHGKLTSNQSGENFNIARALSQGMGFAHPFGDRTGPTAWMPPVFPSLLAGLYWLGQGEREVVRIGLIVCHGCVLVGTAFLVLALIWQTTQRIGPWIGAALFFLACLDHFHFWFKYIDDCWLNLLSLDLLIAGFCWLRSLEQRWKAAGWGLVGGFCALINPIVGFAWGVLSLLLGARLRKWSQLGLAGLFAALALAPWSVRNYLVLGRLVPVKSNLAFEMYQSQCLQPDGLLQNFRSHPAGGGREGAEYRRVGEIAFMDHKWQQLREAIGADPLDYLDRIACRFLGATLWYVPFNRAGEAQKPWLLWVRRITHPLPFLALLLLVLTNCWNSLRLPQWTGIGVYLLYLLPYVATSYYERYAAPLVAVKVLLVIWAVDRMLSLTDLGQRTPIFAATQVAYSPPNFSGQLVRFFRFCPSRHHQA